MEPKNQKTTEKIKRFEGILQRRWAAYTIATCSAVVLYIFLSNLGLIFSGIGSLYQTIAPVVTGVVIAYLMNPLVNLFESRVFFKVKNERTKHGLSVVLALFCILTVLTILMVELIPSLGSSFQILVGNMDTYKANIAKFIGQMSERAARWNLDISSLATSWDEFLNDFMSYLSGNLGTIASASYNLGMGILYR